MAFCRNCGAEMNDDQLYCLNCGAPAQSVGGQPQEKKGSDISVGTLVFSIINFFLCQVLGIISLVFTILATFEGAEKAKKYLPLSMTIKAAGETLSELMSNFGAENVKVVEKTIEK